MWYIEQEPLLDDNGAESGKTFGYGFANKTKGTLSNMKVIFFDQCNSNPDRYGYSYCQVKTDVLEQVLTILTP